MKQHADDSWIQNIYWKLDELSCVLVTGTQWFDAMIPEMEALWNTVLKERIDGYEHRARKDE